MASPIAGPPLCNGWFDWIKPYEADCHDVIVGYIVTTAAACSAVSKAGACRDISGCAWDPVRSRCGLGSSVQPGLTKEDCDRQNPLTPPAYDADDVVIAGQEGTFTPGCTPVKCLRSTIAGVCCREGGLSDDFTRCLQPILKDDRPHGFGWIALACFAAVRAVTRARPRSTDKNAPLNCRFCIASPTPTQRWARRWDCAGLSVRGDLQTLVQLAARRGAAAAPARPAAGNGHGGGECHTRRQRQRQRRRHLVRCEQHLSSPCCQGDCRHPAGFTILGGQQPSCLVAGAFSVSLS
eukprot:COSAG01_NODE_4531_length_4948_cov_5.839905_5_plen_294_part_00